jgi:hypothetical protein
MAATLVERVYLLGQDLPLQVGRMDSRSQDHPHILWYVLLLLTLSAYLRISVCLGGDSTQDHSHF